MYFLLPSPSHGVLSFFGFENLFAMHIYIWRKDSQIRERKALHLKVMAKENK